LIVVGGAGFYFNVLILFLYRVVLLLALLRFTFAFMHVFILSAKKLLSRENSDDLSLTMSNLLDVLMSILLWHKCILKIPSLT